MSDPIERRSDLPSQCPLCGTAVAAWRPEARCPGCGCRVWFRKRTSGDIVILDALPGRTPKSEDIEGLCESLVQSRTSTRIAVNLSQAETVDSSLVASLVGLRRRLLAANGKLVLCCLSPRMREILGYTRLHEIFDTFDTEEDALAALRSASD